MTTIIIIAGAVAYIAAIFTICRVLAFNDLRSDK